MERATKFVTVALALMIAAGLGCGRVEDKVVVRIADPEGAVSPRDVTVGYVNERIDRLPPQMLRDTGGDEGKREFIEEIIRKELLVVAGHRLGFQNDPQLEELAGFFEKDKAWQIYQQRTIHEPAEPTEEDVAEHNVLRGTSFELQEIVLPSEEEALEARRRVTSGGEDFADVAREVSAGETASDGGALPSQLWPDIHLLVGFAIADLDVGEVSEPVEIGGSHRIYKVANRIEPVDPPALEGAHASAVFDECRNARRQFRQYEVNTQMLEDANFRYGDEAFALASERVQAAADEVIPENIAELDFETRLEITQTPIIPEFSEEEAAMDFLTYAVRGVDRTWTLGDLRTLLVETSPMETPKSGDPETLKRFVWRIISREIIEDEIELRGYRDTQEVEDYVALRSEEYIVERVYAEEVTGKVVQPTGGEIREHFQAHRDDYMRPEKVDLRQLIVDTEAEANALRQRLIEGDDDFVDLVRAHAKHSWIRNRDGLLRDYHRGETRMSHLQSVVFDLEVGEISEPVPAPGGYALVTVLSKTPAERMTFDEARGRVMETLVGGLREARLNELLEEVRATVTIDWFDDNLVHVKDPAEAKIEKQSSRGMTTSL